MVGPMRIFTPLLLTGLMACSASEADKTNPVIGHSTEPNATAQGPNATAEGSTSKVAALRKNVAETKARPEHDAKSVEVAHILIAFRGAMRSSQSRSKDEAEELTADLLARALNGEDFTALSKQHSNDPGGGPYTMSIDGSVGFPRGSMAGAFGNVGWRLEVGQIGVADYDSQQSPFGWHIIKRLQ